MLAEKQLLTLDDIEAQMALELPQRETPVTVIISCLALCIGSITVKNVANFRVAANLCAQVQAITFKSVQLLKCKAFAR
jgi:hypothetical protein